MNNESKSVKINIYEHIGSNAAVSSEDGEVLFKRIKKALEKDAKITLDFNNIELITSTFLNAAIGQLYSRYESPFLRTHIKLEHIPADDLELLKKVVIRAKEYFKNKKEMDKEFKKAFENE